MPRRRGAGSGSLDCGCGPGSLRFINGLFEANRNRAPAILIASQIIRDELAKRRCRRSDRVSGYLRIPRTYLTQRFSRHAARDALFTADDGTPAAWAYRHIEANGHSSDGLLWIDPAENHVNTAESRFAACLN